MRLPLRGGGGGTSPPAKKEGRIVASPLARRLAKERGVDLSALSGTGPHGRIVKSDVVGVSPPPSRSSSVSSLPDPFRIYRPEDYDLVPHSAIRRATAERLTSAKGGVPHYYLTSECRVDRLLSVRDRLNVSSPRDAEGFPTWKISVTDVLIKILGCALAEIPDANVVWSEEGMLRLKSCDVGVAVATEKGLLVPIVREADRKGLAEISVETKSLSSSARAGTLTPSDYLGGGASLSNLGMYGVSSFSAVLNPPQATIGAIGATERRAVAGDDGGVVLRDMMTVTFSFDHRAIDGAMGASLLAAFRRGVEDPSLLLR